MSFRPRLVALDVDGTLVDETNIVRADVRAAIQRVLDAGVPVLLSTGRSWASALTVLEQLPDLNAEHVCSNGAVTVRYPPFEVVDMLTFDPRPVAELIRREVPDALLAVEVIGQGYQVTGEFPPGELHGVIEVVDVEEMIGRDVTRIIVRDPNAGEDEFIALAERLGLEGVSYSIGYTAWLDIAPKGVDKAHGLARVCARAGIDAADVLALGDGRNDVQMLEWAGRGVAMANAPREVLDLADAVTGSVEDGGLIDELDRWFAVR
ncbi:HAD family phosphatase [Propioniciclava coleopterorum]|uniref:HAD family phosphatase n=1 Tax=Propioniciclava coleopterorum TaxID=2714937 RepID=A0A6G7Y6M4_9ACTN|nr:HAD family hydrolase [Propioniciclava coleopterorum]QIK72440.1 HAD family phosphatase [Propioniciclava coleopterorum]